MSIFQRLFKPKQLKACPRCLGKGHVDWDDIKRLNQELKWIPGKCAYCKGAGKVDPRIEEKLPVDTTYLTMVLPWYERRSLLKGNTKTLQKAKAYDEQFDELNQHVLDLQDQQQLSVHEIAAELLDVYWDNKLNLKQQKKLHDHVERVIQTHGK